jgi:SpoVK/Ycf46/Vps4 family AAA+-type ATPase
VINGLNKGFFLFFRGDYIDKNVEDKITYWMLKTIIHQGGHRELVDKRNNFYNEELAYFLDLGKFVENDEFMRNEPLKVLKEKYAKLEKKPTFRTNKILEKNIKKISNLIGLTPNEEKFLEFIILVRQYDLLDRCLRILGNELNSNQALKHVSQILDIPFRELGKMFDMTSNFTKSSIVYLRQTSTNTLPGKFELYDEEMTDSWLYLDEDIKNLFKDSIKPCGKTDLNLTNFSHIKKDLDIVIPYLTNAIEGKQTGVNILLYGLPGTGKTELCKLLAKTLKCNLSEISYANANDDPISDKDRMKAYKIAQSILKNEKTLLMYDEAEDIFDSGRSFFETKKQKDKAWINRMLESNTIPTIWISNNIDAIDNAIVRRFDISIEIPIPPKKQRVEILKNYTNGLFNTKEIETIAQNEAIAPALISRAMKVIETSKEQNPLKAFELIVNNTLKAQGYRPIEDRNSAVALPNSYNPKYINCNSDLITLANGIEVSGNARICIYGPAGTGKSAYGRYISEALDKPLIVKKGSDLLSMWVGGTEKNIAEAFLEAKEEKAVLVFDEVDGFLADRSSANKNWEITQVNEMLTQMESFDGIFIATTNLIENLDRASLRRFDMKMEFGYLKSNQAFELFKAECKDANLRITKGLEVEFKKLQHLTPGDFAAVRRQNRFRPLQSAKDFFERLADEVAMKKQVSAKTIGFMS